ncbi:hypothetical protein KK141_03230 [Dyella sp. LX-66]|uniref:hypothetical protein n=1 Tax=unclassified Dyella TaxID=2634549 RepID=UPI001BE1132E|nr:MULTISPECIES: hypothetical protein [unclassified Dyella]MBT2117483.1 hypothetical protein [Dyella sp. LX-1]MBT2138547.1 hypothetical protein [Dyella sp. LX-66]
MKAITGAQLHNLNSALLLVTLALSIIAPFETLLVSYAVLGPLHYLTEMSWLHDRKYFLQQQLSRWLLIGGLILLLPFAIGLGKLPGVALLEPYRVLLLFLVFGGAAVLALARTWVHRLLGVLVLAATWALLRGRLLDALVGVYLVTVIHVFVFTAVFVWNGIRRQPNREGALFLALFIMCPLICFGAPASWSTSPASWTMTSYQLAFSKLNQTAFSINGYALTPEAVFSSPWSMRLTRFFALAYTYHYLNWFSKPTVIPWHRMSSTRWAAIISLWIASIAIYLYDYAAGFLLLLTLSFAHVVLEFPLNHLAFKQLLLGNATARTNPALVQQPHETGAGTA